METNYIQTGKNFGWECPRCGMVWAPGIMACTCKPPEYSSATYDAPQSASSRPETHSDKHSKCAEPTTKSSISKAFNNLEEKKESNHKEPFNWANVDWSDKGGTISIPGYFHDY